MPILCVVEALGQSAVVSNIHRYVLAPDDSEMLREVLVSEVGGSGERRTVRRVGEKECLTVGLREEDVLC